MMPLTHRPRRTVAAVTVVVALAAAPPLLAQSAAPLSLAAAIDEALQHGPALQPRYDAVALAGIQGQLASSQFGLKIAPAISAATDPVFGPMRSAGLSVTKRLSTGTQLFMNVSSYDLGTTGARIHDASYTVGVSQPLLRGFTRTATADVANAARARTGAERDLVMARAALVVQVSQRYFAVVKQARFASAAEEAAERARTLRTASEARTQVGLATELDVLRAEVQESQMAAAVAAANGALAAARDDLALLLGRPLGAGIDVATANPSDVTANLPPIPESADELVSLALSTRVDVTEARDRIGDATRAAEVARWNLLLPVSLDVSYTQRGLGLASATPFSTLVGGWHVGLSTTYALDRSAEIAAASAARISVAAAERTAREAEQRVAAEVRQVQRAWQTAGATVTIQEQALALAKRELKLAELRVERGLGDTLDVVGAQNSVLQAQNALIAAELDQTVFALDLRRAVGVLDVGRFLP